MNACRSPHAPGWRSAVVPLLALTFATFFCLPAFSVSQLHASEEGTIELVYTSELPALSADNALYSLADARYGIYSDYQCTQRAGELVTDETGRAMSAPLDAGRYFIRGELSSPGFALSPRLYQADVAIGKTARVETSATPEFCAPDLILREVNAETGNAAGIGGAALGKATYTVSHFASLDDDKIIAGPNRSWTFTTDDSGEAHLSPEYLTEGSPFYEGPHGLLAMPLGHYTVTVDQAPAGFIATEPVLSADVAQQARTDVEPLRDFEPFVEPLQAIRGDLMFRKTDENGIALAGIPFLLSYANGEGDDLTESHVIVTDEYGDYSSSAEHVSHGVNTNENDAVIIARIGDAYELDEARLQGQTGTWFSMDRSGMRAAPDDANGALPYGSYVLRELPCNANEGMNLVTTQFSINRDGFTVKLDNIVDTRPAIAASALDASDGDRLIRPVSNAVARESVSYHNLITGKGYRVNCTALVQSTGESVPAPDGSPAFASAELTPQQPSGKLDIDVELDCSELAGESIVLRAELVSDGATVVTADDDTANQTLEVEPIVIATAQDAADLDNYVMGSQAAIMECIRYDGLRPGRSYTASCTLNDKATGNALRDAQGKVITAFAEFMPESSEGHVDMELPVDTTGIAGHDIVVFDKLVDEDGRVVASHQDLEDEQQTVKTVKLSSSATDKSDGDKIFDAGAPSVTITDTVNYANLVPGEQYRFKGVLMDKETGCALSENGAPVSAGVPFVPQEVSGSTDVEYSFDASAQSSQVIVAFETLEHDGKVIAEHTDLEDVAQTVTSGDMDPGAALADDDAQAPVITALEGNPASPLTGDFWTRVLLMALAVIAGACICIGYAAHRRRKTLEAIAHSDKPFA